MPKQVGIIESYGLSIGRDDTLPYPYQWWLAIEGVKQDQGLETIAVFRSRGQVQRFAEAIAAKIEAARKEG